MKSVGYFKMGEGTLSTGSWGLASSPPVSHVTCSGAPVCPEEGVPAPGGSPQGMAFLIHMKASYTGEVALVWCLLVRI